jgi:hypothetical protein
MEVGGNAAFMIDIAHARLSVVEELVADGRPRQSDARPRTPGEGLWPGQYQTSRTLLTNSKII